MSDCFTEPRVLTLKEAILEYVARFEVVSFMILYDALDESYPQVSASEKLTTLSELTQSGALKRYDYYVTDRTEPRQFYMPGDTRIHL